MGLEGEQEYQDEWSALTCAGFRKVWNGQSPGCLWFLSPYTMNSSPVLHQSSTYPVEGTTMPRVTSKRPALSSYSCLPSACCPFRARCPAVCLRSFIPTHLPRVSHVEQVGPGRSVEEDNQPKVMLGFKS